MVKTTILTMKTEGLNWPKLTKNAKMARKFEKPNMAQILHRFNNASVFTELVETKAFCGPCQPNEQINMQKTR